MLRLENITKDYITGDSKVQALKGISLQFRKSEFVSILGQSGCGKTTLLNIIIKAVTDIGGLASLPVVGGIILVVISMLLTVIAGLIPAKMASKKDPVEALRTE